MTWPGEAELKQGRELERQKHIGIENDSDTHILTTLKSNRGVFGLLHRLEASWALVVCHDWWMCRGVVEDGCATLVETNISWQVFASQRSLVSAVARRWSKCMEVSSATVKVPIKTINTHFRR